MKTFRVHTLSHRIIWASVFGLVLAGSEVRVRAAEDSAAAAVGYLSRMMDQYHESFIVYEDVSSAGNHFFAWAKISSADAAADINGSWTDHPHSGATAIRCEFRNTGDNNFAGFYFQNGLLPSDARVPIPNFGTVPNAGIDLSDAVRLTFWARGERGAERVEFFVAGVGWVAETGQPQPDSPFHDSSKRHPAPGTLTTLTTDWQQYTIDLRGVDLSYVLGGFGWAASAQENPTGAVFFLDDIRYELSAAGQQRRLALPRFIRSFETLPVQPDPFDSNTLDDIDLVLRNLAFTYDNALALLAFLASGTDDGLLRARLLGDAFVYAATHDRTYDDGRLRTAYMAGDLVLAPGWIPNGRIGTVSIPGFYYEATQTFYEVEQRAVDVGNNAWALIALTALYERTGEQSYLDTTARIAEFIRGFRNDTGAYQGFQGGLDHAECPAGGGPDCPPPTPRPWASTEHNLDVFAGFTSLARVTGDASFATDAVHAQEFADAMWSAGLGCFLAGTKDPETRNENAGQLPLDTQSWSVLALALTDERLQQVFACAEANHAVQTQGLTGFDFNDDRDGIWFEGTAQMAVAYAAAGRSNAAVQTQRALRQAQETAPFGHDGCIVAASIDGLTTGFATPDGLPFLYFRRCHVAATAWLALAQFAINPYYQRAAVICGGDCNDDRTVSIDELIRGVRFVLDGGEPAACDSFDTNLDGHVTVDEIIRSVGFALNGCG